jgi:hypothetical protein
MSGYHAATDEDQRLRWEENNRQKFQWNKRPQLEEMAEVFYEKIERERMKMEEKEGEGE